MTAGRFAPSPTSQLHVGNLRTAVVAWLMARSTSRRYRLRIEDLDVDRVRAASGVRASQERDLALMGITFDPPIVVQSERQARTDPYAAAIESLGDVVYECFCTRKEIAQAASAPHGSVFRAYPGTCRDLHSDERAERRQHRSPALRVRADAAQVSFVDRWHGLQEQIVDDFVIRRSDGVYAYQLAVVVDDAAMGVDQIVRGDDLLGAGGRHVWLAQTLGTPFVGEFAHVGLAVNTDGKRLAKRDGDVTVDQLLAADWSPGRIRGLIGHSLGLCLVTDTPTMDDLLARFDPDAVSPDPWVVNLAL